MSAAVPGLAYEPELAVFRLDGDATLREGIEAVTAAIAAARAAGATRMLVDVRALAGATPPGLGQRYAFATDWARAAQGAVSVALIAPPELVDPGRFGVLVAHGAGMDGDVFDDEAGARAWLARRPASRGVAP